MGNGGMCLKMRPGLISWVAAAPHFAVVGKHTSFEDEIIGDGDHLLCQIRIYSGGSDVHRVVNLIDEELHRLIHVVFSPRPLVIVLKIPTQFFA